MQWALSVDFEFVPEPLFRRTVYNGDISRREGDPGFQREGRGSTKVQISRKKGPIIRSIFRSTIVPGSKKGLILLAYGEWALLYGPNRRSYVAWLKKILPKSIFNWLKENIR